jgi:DNA-binding XRE family transcriptional regulator
LSPNATKVVDKDKNIGYTMCKRWTKRGEQMNFELLKARKELSLTQADMERLTGIKRFRYNRIELDKIKPTINEVYAIAKVVNKKVEEIFLPNFVHGMHKESA